MDYEKEIEELQRQLAEAQELASQINTDWIPANKKLAEQIAERDALIKRLQNAIREVFKAYNRVVKDRHESES